MSCQPRLRYKVILFDFWVFYLYMVTSVSLLPFSKIKAQISKWTQSLTTYLIYCIGQIFRKKVTLLKVLLISSFFGRPCMWSFTTFPLSNYSSVVPVNLSIQKIFKKNIQKYSLSAQIIIIIIFTCALNEGCQPKYIFLQNAVLHQKICCFQNEKLKLIIWLLVMQMVCEIKKWIMNWNLMHQRCLIRRDFPFKKIIKVSKFQKYMSVFKCMLMLIL